MRSVDRIALGLYRRLPERLLRRVARPVASEVSGLPHLLLTGISRSGTSYLSRVLHSLPDVVILNQPGIAHAALAGRREPWLLPLWLHQVRRAILDGTPIENVVADGLPVEDTARGQEVRRYAPPVGRDDFVLGVKNVRAFAARLPDLRTVMPRAPIVACVRNPFDTIDSWKRSFDHLQDPSRRRDVVGRTDDPLLTEGQRDELRQINRAADVAVRRALMWRYLAGRFIEHRERLTVLVYDDLVKDPARAASLVLTQVGRQPNGESLERLAPSTVRGARHALDAHDIDVIRELCLSHAEKLGVGGG